MGKLKTSEDQKEARVQSKEEVKALSQLQKL